MVGQAGQLVLVLVLLFFNKKQMTIQESYKETITKNSVGCESHQFHCFLALPWQHDVQVGTRNHLLHLQHCRCDTQLVDELRMDTQAALEPLLPLLAERLGDANARGLIDRRTSRLNCLVAEDV